MRTGLIIVPSAYWIAFGPHGPRAQTPPGEGWKVLSYTLVGVAASLGIFGLARFFAKPGPSTMNKEWEEATNEILRVRHFPFTRIFESSRATPSVCSIHQIPIHMYIYTLELITNTSAGTKLRANLWYLIRGILRSRSSPEQAKEVRLSLLHASSYELIRALESTNSNKNSINRSFSERFVCFGGRLSIADYTLHGGGCEVCMRCEPMNLYKEIMHLFICDLCGVSRLGFEFW